MWATLSLLGFALHLNVGRATSAEPIEFADGYHFGYEGRAFISDGDLLQSSKKWGRGRYLGTFLSGSLAYGSLEAKLSGGSIYDFNRESSYNTRYSSHQKFGFGFDEALIRIHFKPFNFQGSMTLGGVRWTSNPDAVLAGGYLARYSAYPTELVRFGNPWDRIDDLTIPVLGAKLTVVTPGEMVTQSLVAVVDTMGSESDLSVAYTVDTKIGVGLEIGFGIESPLSDSKTYDTLFNTSRPIMLSLRGSLDLLAMIFLESNPKSAGRIFGEAALMGWNNYEPYFEKRSNRLALMAGVHIPAFGLLDDFCLQWESVPTGGGIGVNYGGTGSWIPGRVYSAPEPNSRYYVYLSKEFLLRFSLQGWLSREMQERSSENVPNNNTNENSYYAMRVGVRF